jgi:hypothetical protein
MSASDCVQEQVLVVGYPTGGDNTSITSGVVSRVEVTQYVHAASHLMAIQIDAAINPGGRSALFSLDWLQPVNFFGGGGMPPRAESF